MDRWPLSAAATSVLRAPDTDAGEVLELALKELVVVGAWRAPRVGGRRGRPRHALARGARPVPPLAPLPVLHRALEEILGDGGRDLAGSVQRLLRRRPGLPERLRADARAALVERGLLHVERRRLLGVLPRTTAVRTQLGESWLADARDRMRWLAERPDDARQAVAAGGLLLLLDAAALEEVAEAVRALRDVPPRSGGVVIDDRSGDEDLAGLDALGGSLDAAIAEGGAGGDGGGGDGGGGGD